MNLIFKCFRLFFQLLKLLFFKLTGKPFSIETKTNDSPNVHADFKNPSKHDSFLSYGGLKWYSLNTPQALKTENLKKFPQGTAILFELFDGDEPRDFEIKIFGDLYEEQLAGIEKAFDCAIKDLKLKKLFINEIHLVKNPGQYLDKSGVPDKDIAGFSLDAEGAVILHEDAALDFEFCKDIITNLIKEELNRDNTRVKARDTLWNFATSIKERLINNREYHPSDNKRIYGTLRGRPIIDMDAPIADGVYLGAPAHEAIYVNKDSDTLNQIYRNFLSEIRKIKIATGLGFEEQVLRLAISATQKTFLHTSQDKLLKLRQSHRICADEEIALDFFIHNETGDSEHASLLTAYLLEKLNKEQPTFLSGKVSIDRNWIPGGGHAWVRYTHNASNIYFIDAVKNYLGRLDDYSSSRWPYERQKDLSFPRQTRPL